MAHLASCREHPAREDAQASRIQQRRLLLRPIVPLHRCRSLTPSPQARPKGGRCLTRPTCLAAAVAVLGGLGIGPAAPLPAPPPIHRAKDTNGEPAPYWPENLRWAATAPSIRVHTSEELQRVLNDTHVPPGTVIWVEPGHYTPPTPARVFTCKLNGTPERPIIVRGRYTPPCPQKESGTRSEAPEPSVINGGIWADPSANVWFWGLEITNTSTSRLVADRLCGVNLLFDQKRGKSVVNCIIHDTGQPGIGFWNQGPNAMIYGCIVYHNGVYDDLHYTDIGGHPRGPGVYAHNDQGEVRVSDNIFFGNFGEGVHAYGATGYVNGFVVSNNIAFMNNGDQIFLGSDKEPMSAIRVENNVAYREPGTGGKRCMRVGYTVPVTDAVVKNNVVIGATWALQIERVHTLTMEGNKVYGEGDGAILVRSDGTADATYEGSKNTIWFPKSQNAFAWAVGEGGATMYRVSDMTAFLRLPSHAITVAQAPPTEPVIRIYHNRYEANRYHVAIWNPAKTNTVNVKIPQLPIGTHVQVWDVQSLSKGPILDANYTDAGIVLPMNRTDYDEMIGPAPHMKHVLHHTKQDFGAFLVITE